MTLPRIHSDCPDPGKYVGEGKVLPLSTTDVCRICLAPNLCKKNPQKQSISQDLRDEKFQPKMPPNALIVPEMHWQRI